jgi:hypothetical protein
MILNLPSRPPKGEAWDSAIEYCATAKSPLGDLGVLGF